MSDLKSVDVDEVNNNIFGTPQLQDLANTPALSRHSLSTSAYETPLESIGDLESEKSANMFVDEDAVSAYSGGVHDNEVSTIKDEKLDLRTTKTNQSVISNPHSYFSQHDLDRVNTQADLLELDVERLISRLSRKSNKSGKQEEGILISEMQWDGPDDKENPQNWSAAKKWFVTMTAAGICLVVTFGSSLYVSGSFDIISSLHTSQEMVLAGLTFYLLGLALGPLFAAPLSEIFGRKIVYIISLPTSMLFIMGVGLSQNIGSILVLRFFSGFFASPAMAIAGGTISDIWSPDMMGLAMSTFCLAPFMGPVIGPVIGGFVAEKKGWKWCLWVNLMAAGAILPLVFLADESYKNTIMRKRAEKRGIKIREAIPKQELLKFILVVTMLRPMKMLVVEPIVIVFSIYVAFVFAVLFGFFEAFPVIFRGTYFMDLGVSGLPFLGVGIGLIIGTLFFIYIDRFIFFKVNEDGSIGKKGKNGEPFKHTPESRLIFCKYGAVIFPISLFWLGWTARHSVHWMAPVAAGVPFGFSLILIFFSVMLYFSMSYPPLSVASAFLANNLLRYVLASVFPLFTVQMYERLGNGWASSLFGFIALAMVPVPWVFEKWGPALRSRSQFGFDAIKKEMLKDAEQDEKEERLAGSSSSDDDDRPTATENTPVEV